MFIEAKRNEGAYLQLSWSVDRLAEYRWTQRRTPANAAKAHISTEIAEKTVVKARAWAHM